MDEASVLKQVETSTRPSVGGASGEGELAKSRQSGGAAVDGGRRSGGGA
jgi:hypothetical protein